MDPCTRPRVKICCIASVEEARLAVGAGASAVGLVSAMPSGPGPIPEDEIALIRRHVPPPVATFLLTCAQDAAAVVSQLRRTGCNTVQLCDELTAGSYADLRAALPGLSVVQVIHVSGKESLGQALRVAPYVDAILLDSGRPTLAVKELGGTGRVHDWSVSAKIRQASPVPVFLAGGLTPTNVRQAVEEVAPFGLDVCTGVRTNGRLDPQKLSAFMAAVGPPTSSSS
jgi:phosphoribosylanthranilate isomerase